MLLFILQYVTVFVTQANEIIKFKWRQTQQAIIDNACRLFFLLTFHILYKGLDETYSYITITHWRYHKQYVNKKKNQQAETRFHVSIKNFYSMCLALCATVQYWLGLIKIYNDRFDLNSSTVVFIRTVLCTKCFVLNSDT